MSLFKNISLPTFQIARYTLSFAWIYHGLFPKILSIAPIEQAMTASIGFGPEISYLITKVAGIGEIVFGLIIFIFYLNKTLIWGNIFILFMLMIFVGFMTPDILIEAFNPITTNVMMIAISLILLNEEPKETPSSKSA